MANEHLDRLKLARLLPQAIILICILSPCSLFAGYSVEKGIELLQEGKLVEARLLFEERIESNGEDAEAMHYLGRTHYRLGDADKAVDYCKRAVEIKEDAANYHFWLGKTMGLKAENANMVTKARLAPKIIAEFEKTISLDPMHIEGHIAAANFYVLAPAIMGGDIDKARREAETLMGLGSKEGNLIMIEIYEREGNYDLAEREYEKFEATFDASTDDQEFFNQYGYFLLSRKKFDKAVEKFRKQVELAPGEPHPHYSLGDGLRSAGRLEEALSEYNTAIEIDPGFEAAKEKYDDLRKAIANADEESIIR